MALELLYALEALADLEEIYRFIAEHSPDRAAALVADIRQRYSLRLDKVT